MSHDHEDKPRLSWREIDQRRDGSRTRRDEPRGFAAREEQARAKETTLSTADALFSMNKGGAEGARLAAEMHAAHGSEGFGLACRSYFDVVGVPNDLGLLGLFLDTADPELIVPALEALLEARNANSLELTSGLKSQLRVLEQDRDDTIAGISEELLAD